MHNENYRIWYDDLRLIEDPSVRRAGPADEGCADLPKPEWPAEAVQRGFVVVGRPSLPMTYSSYKPSRGDVGEPIRLTLAPGETDSVVVFIQNLLVEPIVLLVFRDGQECPSYCRSYIVEAPFVHQRDRTQIAVIFHSGELNRFSSSTPRNTGPLRVSRVRNKMKAI